MKQKNRGVSAYPRSFGKGFRGILGCEPGPVPDVRPEIVDVVRHPSAQLHPGASRLEYHRVQQRGVRRGENIENSIQFSGHGFSVFGGYRDTGPGTRSQRMAVSGALGASTPACHFSGNLRGGEEIRPFGVEFHPAPVDHGESGCSNAVPSPGAEMVAVAVRQRKLPDCSSGVHEKGVAGFEARKRDDHLPHAGFQACLQGQGSVGLFGDGGFGAPSSASPVPGTGFREFDLLPAGPVGNRHDPVSCDTPSGEGHDSEPGGFNVYGTQFDSYRVFKNNGVGNREKKGGQKELRNHSRILSGTGLNSLRGARGVMEAYPSRIACMSVPAVSLIPWSS